MVVSRQKNDDRLDLKILTPPSSKPPASTPNLQLKIGKLDSWSKIKFTFQCLLEQTMMILFVHFLYNTVVHRYVGTFQVAKKKKTEVTKTTQSSISISYA